ncbi:hypothetical protein G9A89_000003 [Geosiphon pyriformis]|nr:hypothetical protein G9A89_000003 [Geosiphon pyriformis]
MGFWDDFGEFALAGIKIGGKICISGAMAGAIVATAGTAAPIVAPLVGCGIIGIGNGVKELGKESDSEVIKYLGETVIDTGLGTICGGVLTAPQSTLSQISDHSFKVAKKTGDIGEALVGITAKTG